MVKSIKGSYKFKFHPEGADGEEWDIDFTPPWRRIDMIADLEKALGVKLPAAADFSTPEARAKLGFNFVFIIINCIYEKEKELNEF